MLEEDNLCSLCANASRRSLGLILDGKKGRRNLSSSLPLSVNSLLSDYFKGLAWKNKKKGGREEGYLATRWNRWKKGIVHIPSTPFMFVAQTSEPTPTPSYHTKIRLYLNLIQTRLWAIKGIVMINKIVMYGAKNSLTKCRTIH